MIICHRAPADVLRMLAGHGSVDISGATEGDGQFSIDADTYEIQYADCTQLPEDLSPESRSPILLAPPDWVMPLLAMRPLIAAGLMLETPVALTSEPISGDFDSALADIGWHHGLDQLDEPNEQEPELSIMLFMAHITAGADLGLVHQLFHKAYEDSALVETLDQQAFAFDHARISQAVFMAIHTEPGEDSALVSIRACCRRDGKIGPAGWVQAMNRVAGEDWLKI